jgi:hypothetical protein
METRDFWIYCPMVDSKMWQRIQKRFSRAPQLFCKRMGVNHESSTISLGLENFFEVRGVNKDSESLVHWIDKSSAGVGRKLYKLFDDVCDSCGSRDIWTHHVEGSVICQNCGCVLSECADCPTASNDNYGPSAAITTGHTDKPRRVNQFIYKRCNHFRFWLSRIQAKETSGVKPSVVEAVRRELQKERIEMGDERITYDKVRAMLKKLRLQKYYNNCWFITAKLSGKQPPILSALQEEKLVSMFHAIQTPYQRVAPAERVNMISYSYLLRKMSESLGWTEFAAYFPLLKSRAKVFQQDRIWEAICKEVGFNFQKSIS